MVGSSGFGVRVHIRILLLKGNELDQYGKMESRWRQVAAWACCQEILNRVAPLKVPPPTARFPATREFPSFLCPTPLIHWGRECDQKLLSLSASVTISLAMPNKTIGH